LLCAAFRLPSWAPGRTGLYHPSFPHLAIEEDGLLDLADLFAWIEDGGLVESHNSFFEAGIWANVCVPRFGWPALPTAQRRCSAAKAAAHALPRGLDGAVAALGLAIRKDAEGGTIMKKLAQPRNPIQADYATWGRQHAPCGVCAGVGRVASTRKDGTPTVKGAKCASCVGSGVDATRALPPMPRLYHESLDQLELLWAYCRQDVLVEEALSRALPDLSPDETAIYSLDQSANEYGFRLDTDAVSAALALIDDQCLVLNAELAVLTGGQVQKATQRAQMMIWLREVQGLTLEDTRKETLDDILDHAEAYSPWRTPPTPTALRALALMRMLGRSSTAKYVSMSQWVCPDDRVHGGLLYHGASTGRWTGAGVQPHNFTKQGPPSQDDLWDVLKTRDAGFIVAAAPLDTDGEPTYTSVMEALSQGLRGAIIPSTGCQFYVADYASIEARVLVWMAGEEAALDVFRQGADPYCAFAPSVYGHTITKADKEKRDVCKIAVLGLGYQMGAAKFVATCAAAGVTITEEFGRTVVDAYRSKYRRVKALWRDMEQAAIAAVLDGPDYAVRCGPVTWLLEGDFLYGVLPSGRRLAYPFPEIREQTTSWGERRDQLTFMGIDPYTRQWGRQHTYGGSLVENVDQALSRDLLACALQRCAASGVYRPVLTVHDEIICEAPMGVGCVHEFEQLVAATPAWGTGIPVVAEGFCATRYHK
jgi:DNA polymerase